MPDPFIQLLRDWQNFYLHTGTAAATLTGLMFVAASLGASLITPATTTSVRTFVTPTVIRFSAVLIIATLIAIPTETALLLSSLLGLGRLAGLCYTITTAVHLWLRHADRSYRAGQGLRGRYRAVAQRRGLSFPSSSYTLDYNGR